MKKNVVALFLFCFVVFNLNFSVLNPVSPGDTIPARLVSFNILQGQGIYFDNYIREYTDSVNDFTKLKTLPYFLQKYKNHYVSSYPILAGVVVMPLSIPFYVYLDATNNLSPKTIHEASLVVEKLGASIIASLSVVLFFLLFMRLTANRGMSIFFALIFAFCSQTFSISSQLLWQHGIANLFLILSLLYFSKKSYLLAILFGILSFWSRYNFFFYLLLLMIFIFRDKEIRQSKLLYFTAFLVGVLVLSAYNLVFYGDISGFHAVGDFDVFQIVNNLLGVLFSPARGMMFYTPYFAFGLLTFFQLLRSKINKTNKSFLWLNYYYFISVIVLNSLWGAWWGGHTFGDRLLADAAVPVTILACFSYRFIKNNLVKLTFFILVGYSLLAQLIGVFYFSSGWWDEYPVNIDRSLGRLWDFSDNPLTRDLAAGPNMLGLNRFYVNISGWKGNAPGGQCTLKKISEYNFLSYKKIKIIFTNNSNSNWSTTGDVALNLRVLYIDRQFTIESPIVGSTLPPVINSGQTVTSDLLLVPPDRTPYNIVIVPSDDRAKCFLRI